MKALVMALRPLMASLAVLLALPAQPASAQGFLQSIFGFGSPQQRPVPYRSPYAPFAGPYSPYPPRPYESAPLSGGYRTLCVRLCDGYYFPISYAAPRSALATDADKCTASCGADARLFYYPTAGGEIETMVDLSGRGYADLPNAFKYRKRLVAGCSCRPQPWSEAELARHRAYALNEPPAGEPSSAASPAVAAIAGQSLAARGELGSAPEFQVAGTQLPPPAGDVEYREPEPIEQDPLVRTDVLAAGVPRTLDRAPRVAPAKPIRKAQAQPLFGGLGGGGGASKSPYVWPGDRR